MNSIQKKSNFLGTNYTSASYKLTRQILFDLLSRLSLLNCFRCGKQIEDVVDLSIDHKQPWLYVSKDLFWDLNNISFSHNRCNSGASRYNPDSALKLRKVGPKGTAWCSKHKDFLPVQSFSKGSRWDGLRETCDDCRKERYKLGLGR